MTVSSEVSTSGPYVGNGVTTVFPFEFKIVDEAHLRVVIALPTGVSEDLSFADGDFTVDGVGSDDGGSIALAQPLAAGKSLILLRAPPITQDTVLESQSAFLAANVERRFDMTVMQVQAVKEGLSRALVVEPGQEVPSSQLIVEAGQNADRASTAAGRAESALADFMVEAKPDFAVKLETTTTAGVTDYPLWTSAPRTDGHLHVNVDFAGIRQPKDGSAYIIINDGGTIRLGRDPGDGRSLYVEGAAVYSMAFPPPDGSVYDTEADFDVAYIAAGDRFAETSGYYEAADGGGRRLAKLFSMPSPVQQWHKQVDGKWFEVAEPPTRAISIKAFGARLGGSQTPSERRARIQTAIDFGAAKRYRIIIPTGTWIIDDYLEWHSHSEIEGAGQNATVLQFSTLAAENTNLLQPSAFNGTVIGWKISGLTLDGNREARKLAGTVVGVGNVRPGASNLATMSASYGLIDDVKSIGSVLHSFDICAGGDINPSTTRREYVYPSTPDAVSTTPSRFVTVTNSIAEDHGDDGFTNHYDLFTTYYRCRALGASNHYTSNLNGTNGFEFDDGSQYGRAIECYSAYSSAGFAAKGHNDGPAASHGAFISCFAEYCGTGFSVYGDTGAGRAEDWEVTNCKVRNPLNRPGGDGVLYGARFANYKNLRVNGLDIEAPVYSIANPVLSNGLYISLVCKGVQLDNLRIVNWPGSDVADTAALRVTPNSEVSLGKYEILEPGARGIHWTGAVVSPRNLGNGRILQTTPIAGSIGLLMTVYPSQGNLMPSISGFETLASLGGQAWTDLPTNVIGGHLQTRGLLNAGDDNVRTYHNVKHPSTSIAGDTIFGAAQNDGSLSTLVFARGTGGVGYNSANACLKVATMETTGRSVASGGTINASGADYAEYHEVVEALWGSVAPGTILGFNIDGLLTDRFAEIVGPCVAKSTKPYGVGGDDWGEEDRVCAAQGCEPVGEEPSLVMPDQPPDEASVEVWDEYEQALEAALTTLQDARISWQARKAAFAIAYEAERIKRDRIAKSGYVPVNIAATAVDIGKYLVPADDGAGGITAALMDMDAAEDAATTIAALRAVQKAYRRSIGVVIGIATDGRPLVEVKVG